MQGIVRLRKRVILKGCDWLEIKERISDLIILKEQNEIRSQEDLHLQYQSQHLHLQPGQTRPSAQVRSPRAPTNAADGSDAILRISSPVCHASSDHLSV